MTDQNKTHGVLTDRQMLEKLRRELNLTGHCCARCGHLDEESLLEVVNSIRDHLAAPQSPVTPASVEMALDALRAEQAAAVMPLIGPLLDAWENVLNDEKGHLRKIGIGKHLDSINRAMVGNAPVASADERALQAAAKAVENSADVWEGFSMQDAKTCIQAYCAELPCELIEGISPTVSATAAKIAELLDIVEHPVSFPSTIEDPATRWEQSRRMQCSACYAKEDENEAIEHLASCVWHKALAQRDRMRELVRDLRNAAPTPPTSAADAFKQAEITERGDFHLTLRFPSCRLASVAAAAIAASKETT